MNAEFGAIRKTVWAYLLFAIPAFAILAISIGLEVEGGVPFSEAFKSVGFGILGALVAVILAVGVWFILRPIMVLTPEGVRWPDGRTLLWSEITKIESAERKSTAVSDTTGARTVVHEIVRFHQIDGDVIEFVTTWASPGPQQAADRINACFAKVSAA